MVYTLTLSYTVMLQLIVACIIPAAWKCAVVVPLEKTNPFQSFQNLVYLYGQQLHAFTDSHKILQPQQSGFWNVDSCTLGHWWQCFILRSKQRCTALFSGLSEAFDSHHKILLCKLQPLCRSEPWEPILVQPDRQNPDLVIVFSQVARGLQQRAVFVIAVRFYTYSFLISTSVSVF